MRAATPPAAPAELLAQSRELSRELRKRRLRYEKKDQPLHRAPIKPDIFFDHAPCGTYPIIALRTVPCDKYVLGYCGPCSYSARSYPTGLGQQGLYAGLMGQLEWVLDHFAELFVTRANGRLDNYHLREAPERPWYMLQLAGESSFFRDAEVPPKYRRAILERLVAFQEKRGINLHLMLECRPEHLLAAHESGELRELEPLLEALDVVVNTGFECHDDFLRNVVFAKDLSRDVFSQAMAVAQSYRLDPGVFLFAGATVLTTSEMLEEVDRSLGYLQELKLFANIMVPNLQTYTLPDLLYEAGRYRLPEPYFLLDLADRLLDFRPGRPHAVTPFNWFLGGLESDPLPRLNLLANPQKFTSDAVTHSIHRCVLELVRTLDDVRYRREAARLRAKPDYAYYLRDLTHKDARPWFERLAENLEFAQSHLEVYDSQIQSGLDTVAWETTLK